jgi:hypothetical protein
VLIIFFINEMDLEADCGIFGRFLSGVNPPTIIPPVFIENVLGGCYFGNQNIKINTCT